jgi:AraC family transcriptional regulator, regulatory protein of adaptative response / DNA-3-methyladenine glycosylase II
LTGARAETIRALARAVAAGRINFEGVVDSDAFLERFCEIPGIGQWTAQYVAMRALGEPDAFPSSDLGLLRALGLSSHRELEQRAEEWRPWRAYAAMYLWKMLSYAGSAKKIVVRTAHEKSDASGESFSGNSMVV